MTTENRPPSVYVDDVFEEVLALPPDARDAAIDERCAGHPSLAAEVRALLSAEVDREPAPGEVFAGAKLGRYQLDTCLGRGASASVWKAWDTHLRTWTALKLIRHDLRTHADALQNVLHEARAASAIISDHVVRIKAAGKLAAGPYYVEMQLCAEQAQDGEGDEALVIGRTLAEDPPRGVREAARLVMEAARGVEAAHRVGVLHRDVKPANVLLTPVSRRALVADFGLSAAHLYPEAAPGTPSTATVTIHLHDVRGPLVGTPAFMPPEQAWGHPATRTNDVYALGATLYALLARRAPYQPPTGGPLPALEVVARVRKGPPVRLSAIALQVPSRLVRIVEKAMERDAARRYPTAAALADDLDRFLRDLPTSVDTGRPWLTAALWTRRNWGLVSTAAVLGSMLFVFSGAVIALEMRRAALASAVEDAEARLTAARIEAADAERVRADAVAARDAAEALRDRAEQQRQVALIARDRAKQGQTEAEKRAEEEIAARMLAEGSALLALQDKVAAEQQLERERTLRHGLEQALDEADQRYREVAAHTAWQQEQLTREMEENRLHEADIQALTRDLVQARNRIGLLEAQLALTPTSEPEDEPIDATPAPWLQDPQPP